MGGATTAGAIDVHQHYVPAVLCRVVQAAASANAGFARRYAFVLGRFAPALCDLEDRLREMDRAGIELAVLSAPPPAAEAAPPAGRPALAAAINDALVAAARRRPGRLAVAISLPLPDVDAACAELARLAGEPAVVACSVLAGFDGSPLDAPSAGPLRAALAGSAVAVLLHPSMVEPSEPFGDWGLTSVLSAPVSTALAAARLVLSGALERDPGLDVVVPHLGGVLPYLYDRLVEQATSDRVVQDAGRGIEHYLCHRLYYDSCSFHAPALRCALETVGADRVMLGSDFPFRGDLARAVAVLDHLPAAQRAAVARDTALRCLGERGR